MVTTSLVLVLGEANIVMADTANLAWRRLFSETKDSQS